MGPERMWVRIHQVMDPSHGSQGEPRPTRWTHGSRLPGDLVRRGADPERMWVRIHREMTGGGINAGGPPGGSMDPRDLLVNPRTRGCRLGILLVDPRSRGARDPLIPGAHQVGMDPEPTRSGVAVDPGRVGSHGARELGIHLEMTGADPWIPGSW
jgi:hypothetical protein